MAQRSNGKDELLIPESVAVAMFNEITGAHCTTMAETVQFLRDHPEARHKFDERIDERIAPLSVAQLARRCNISVEKARQTVKDEPGVICWGSARKRMYRIPPHIADRIERRITNPDRN